MFKNFITISITTLIYIISTLNAHAHQFESMTITNMSTQYAIFVKLCACNSDWVCQQVGSSTIETQNKWEIRNTSSLGKSIISNIIQAAMRNTKNTVTGGYEGCPRFILEATIAQLNLTKKHHTVVLTGATATEIELSHSENGLKILHKSGSQHERTVNQIAASRKVTGKPQPRRNRKSLCLSQDITSFFHQQTPKRIAKINSSTPSPDEPADKKIKTN